MKQRKKSKGRHLIFLITLLSLMSPLCLRAQSVRKKVQEGNKLYQEKKFDQALNRYQDALLSDPENKLVLYNVAGSLYKKKKYEDALKEYQKVLGSENIDLDQEAYYNLGNTLFRMGKLPESILAYQQALKLDPNDMDAKYNLEYVRRKLKENMEKQPRDNQGQEQQNQQEKSSGLQDEEEPKNLDQQKDQQGAAGETENKNKLSKEEAERILDALKNDEKKIQKMRKMKTSGTRRIKKDW
ncbi:MAG: tetratricopeptide repeat protein [Candidatus Aminicenantes bacterium]|nr:tetratricopeptide repeat protein [Candidatus Aminicenantes bacterium]